MNTHKLPAAILLLLLGAGSLNAQSADEMFYRQEAGGSAILYRGHQAFTYSGRFNGTYWITGSEFRNGTVRYNGKNYDGIPLNLDAVRQDLVITNASGQGRKVLAREFVEWFTVDGRKFVNLQAVSPGAPSGYWEVLSGKGNGTQFLRQVVKKMEKDIDNEKRAMFAGSENYDPDTHTAFIVKSISFCMTTPAGEVVPVRTKSRILKLFPDRRKEIRRHISALERKLDRSLTMAEYGVEVINFVEQR